MLSAGHLCGCGCQSRTRAPGAAGRTLPVPELPLQGDRSDLCPLFMIKVLKTLWLDLFKEVRAGETGPYPHLCVLRGLGPRPQTVAGEQARGWEMQPRLVARAPLLFWGGSWCLSLGAGAFGQLVGSSASTLSLGLQDPVVELLGPRVPSGKARGTSWY